MAIPLVLILPIQFFFSKKRPIITIWEKANLNLIRDKCITIKFVNKISELIYKCLIENPHKYKIYKNSKILTMKHYLQLPSRLYRTEKAVTLKFWIHNHFHSKTKNIGTVCKLHLNLLLI